MEVLLFCVIFLGSLTGLHTIGTELEISSPTSLFLTLYRLNYFWQKWFKVAYENLYCWILIAIFQWKSDFMYFQKASHVNVIINFLKKQCSLNSGCSLYLCKKWGHSRLASWWRYRTSKSPNKRPCRKSALMWLNPTPELPTWRALKFYFLPFSFFRSISPVVAVGAFHQREARGREDLLLGSMLPAGSCAVMSQPDGAGHTGEPLGNWEIEKMMELINSSKWHS